VLFRSIDISGAKFIEGIDYTFPMNTIINPNQFIVLASNLVQFKNRYGFIPFGEYSDQLDNGGEEITFISSTNDTIFSVEYNDKSPWPETADGKGFSLVTKERYPTGDLNDPSSWTASSAINGSPGIDDPVSTEVENDKSHLPKEFCLYQNYPNPFNPVSTIRFTIPIVGAYYSAEGGKPLQIVTLKVYDILGKEVATLVNEQKHPGYYNVEFDASILPSGIYIYQLRTGNFLASKKMLLLK